MLIKFYVVKLVLIILTYVVRTESTGTKHSEPPLGKSVVGQNFHYSLLKIFVKARIEFSNRQVIPVNMNRPHSCFIRVFFMALKM